MVGCASTPSAPQTEAEIVEQVKSPNEDVSIKAMMTLEKKYPTSTAGLPAVRSMLTDSRPKVRRKAARVLGVLHAEVTPSDVDAICAMLQSSDPLEATDALKALRGLNAPTAIPKVVAVLQNANTHLVRDALRTLAVLGKADLIPTIEPLLQHPDPAVKADAQDAIFKLRAKAA